MKCSVFVGTSLDGFIARPDGSFDFLPEVSEPHGYEEFFASVDALVMGRNTYETALAFPSWPYGAKPVFVLSRRPSLAHAPEGAVVEHLSGELREIVGQLEARGFRHLYADGGNTIHQFIAAGLIQRIVVTRVPVLIGTGIPLFGAVPGDIRLRHMATRAFPSGLVQSEYEVEAG